MNPLIGIISAMGLLILYLVYRLIRIRLGLKDSNYGGVQRSAQLPPPTPPQADFLPGSRIDPEGSLKEIYEELAHQTKVEKRDYQSMQPKRKLGLTKKDIIRSYMVDTLLDKPKFEDPYA